MEKMVKEKGILDQLTQRIDFTIKSKSFRRYLMGHVFGTPDPAEAGLVAWTVNFNRRIPPDIEIYVDTMARYAAAQLKFRNIYDDETFRKVMVLMFTETVVHELLHWYIEIFDEDAVDAAVCAALADPDEWALQLVNADALEQAVASTMRGMLYTSVQCPKINGLVDWATCFGCDDFEKYPGCPLQKIREDCKPREYFPKKYHVSELYKPRYSFYERFNPLSWDWNDYWAMLWGRGFGDFIESLYPEGVGQFEFLVSAADLAKRFGTELLPIDDFNVTGHADIVDDAGKLVMEIKTQFNLKYVVDAPNPIHKWQLQAYYTLGLIQFPEIFNEVKELRLVYFGRMWRGHTTPPYIEHVVPMDTIDLLTPARMLRLTEDTGIPPDLRCPEWMCKRCGHKMLCRGNEGREIR